MTKAIEVKVSELVVDFDIYPRGSVDSTHVGHITDAYNAGNDLPPIVIDKKSRRVIDGVHRIRSKGPKATIMAIEKTYKNDGEMFLDAMRLNSGHGRKLNPFDRVRCVQIAERLHVDGVDLAASLKMTVDKLAELTVARTATAVGKGKLKVIPLKNTISWKAGGKLNKRQQDANAKLGGMHAVFYINQVILLLESDLIDTTNERLLERLAVLGGLIDKYIAAVS